MVSWCQGVHQNPTVGFFTCQCCGIIRQTIIKTVVTKVYYFFDRDVFPTTNLNRSRDWGLQNLPTNSISINMFLSNEIIPSSMMSAANSPSRKSPAAASQTHQSASEPDVAFTLYCVYLSPQSVRKRHISVVVCILQLVFLEYWKWPQLTVECMLPVLCKQWNALAQSVWPVLLWDAFKIISSLVEWIKL